MFCKSSSSCLFSLIAVLSVFPGCAKDTTPSGSGGTGGTGGTAGNSSSNPSEYSQSELDADVVYGIIQDIWALYNQNIAGKPSGDQNITTDCPLGGSVHITGTTTVVSSSSGLASLDLTYEMDNCGITKTSTTSSGTLSVSLTFSGTITQKGSYNGNVEENINIKSESIAITGSTERTGVRAKKELDMTCSFSVSTAYSNSKGSTSGVICGRDVSWSN